MAAGVATMGVGISNPFDADANDAEANIDSTSWVCCESNSVGCTDMMGSYYPDDYRIYAPTCTTC